MVLLILEAIILLVIELWRLAKTTLILASDGRLVSIWAMIILHAILVEQNGAEELVCF